MAFSAVIWSLIITIILLVVDFIGIALFAWSWWTIPACLIAFPFIAFILFVAMVQYTRK